VRVTRAELRHTIRHALLEQAEDEMLPTSEFSPAGRPLTLYIVDPSDENYEKVRPMFSVDALGHGFYVHGHDLLLIDGGAGLDADQLKAVEAHEASHAILGHTEYNNPQFELEADELAVQMLQDRGYDAAADLLIDRLEAMGASHK
tara:strand:+ start:468 stop:905 length:438 start_codon:yes stop_codon:yes gene_type:complete